MATEENNIVPEGILLGIGNPLLDILISGDKALLDEYNLLPNNAILATEDHRSIYEKMIDKYEPAFLAGGATQNSIRVAQWLLKRPGTTTFFGAVGDDKYKDILEETARKVGVNVCYYVHKGMTTGRCGAIITGEDRSLVTELGAAQHFKSEFLEKPESWNLVEKAKYFYIGGFFIPVSIESILKLVKHAVTTNKTVIMNLHATFLCKYYADPELNLLQYVDVLFGNGDEAAEFSKLKGFPTKDIKEMARLTAQLPKLNSSRKRIVVFTQGRAPTIVAHDGKVTEVAVVPVEPKLIKDTNGCGDAFVGGFLSQLVKGKPLSECLRCGSYASRVVIQHFGCNFPPEPDFK
ncbi:hypothetical protein ACJMK2_043645 [Sinanodonta woodiana]|uniref:Adenosine kinase n=1 Tax=Sinanodonta woodiana TaxID=1069815 RepID=A0ABD3VXK6_SINWO